MYLYQAIKDTADAVEFCETKLNLDPKEFDLRRVKRLEIYSANASDGGEDYCEVRVIDSNDVVFCVRRLFEF